MAIDRAKVSKQAEQYLASGKLDRALEEFQKLLDDKPDDFNLMNRMGDVILQAGRMPEAIEMFRRAAGGYERDGFTNKAIAVLKKAHRAAADDVDVAARLAELYRQMSMIREAIAIHIEVAEVFTKKGLIKRALEEFAQVVDLDPKNLKNKVKLADLYNKEGMKDRAASIYLEVAEALALEQMHGEATQVLERAKAMVTTPQVYLTHSRLCIIQKDLAGAAQVLRQGLDQNPRSTEILEALAEVELQAKHPDVAMEVLAQVPQMGERTLALCERSLRELSRSGRTDLGLQLFKSIGKEFARRGSGELVVRALNNGLQGNFTTEAWLQLAEVHHQTGNKQDRIDALRNAMAAAQTEGNGELAAQIESQLGSLGVTAEQMGSPVRVMSMPTPTSTGSGSLFEATDVDPVKRLQIQQLEKDAENFLRNRFMDKAQDSYQKILELDPANRDAINRIADIIKASGRMSSVQMHYVKMAEKLAPMGHKGLAVELLDKAEAMFPGSTRLYRRTLGLMDVQAAPSPAQHTLPSLPASAQAAPPQVGIPIPLEASPIASFPGTASGVPLESLPIIPLDVPGFEMPVAPRPAIAMPPSTPALTGLDALINLDLEANPTVALPRATPAPPAPAPWEVPAPPEPLPPMVTMPEALPPVLPPLEEVSFQPPPTIPMPEPDEISSADVTGSEIFQVPGLEPLELEPLSFVPPPAAAPPPVPAPMSVAAFLQPPAAIDDELANLLPDIDFQLDYGSPEEAKMAITEALTTWPDHPELLSRLEMAESALRKLGHQPKPAALDESDFTGSFFDLTDVLGEALMDSGEGEEMHDATNVVEKIQSVEELFNAFREGVEQQVRGDDFDTHYNLGIAYKEMMLIEPAMEEFKHAMRDPERTLECCSMLSICEMSQGNLDAAADWLVKGIETPGFPPEDSIGLRYDLGEIRLLQGRTGEAKALFREVHEMDSEYREVASKL